MKAVFFDLDETLCNTDDSRVGRAKVAFSRVEKLCDGLSAEEFVRRALEPDPRTGWPLGPRAVLDELGIAGTPEGQSAVAAWFFDGCLELLDTFPGARKVIRELSRDYVLGVITNGREPIQRSKFDHLGMGQHFRVFLSSEAAGHLKPSREIFEIALGRVGVDARDAVFVGDHLDVDVAGARAAGMQAVWFNARRRRLPPEVSNPPDAIVHRYSELPALFARWRAETRGLEQ